MRRAVLGFLLVAGCALDESGLLGGAQPDAGFDAPSVDGNADAVGTPDAFADALDDAAVVDAPLDSPTIDAPYDAGADAQPVLTITGGSYALLGLDAGLCSLNANTATSFALTNDRDASIDLVWVDYACNEQPYGTFAPLGGKTQGTYVTHVWRIRNDADKAFLAGFVLDSAATYTVAVH